MVLFFLLLSVQLSFAAISEKEQIQEKFLAYDQDQLEQIQAIREDSYLLVEHKKERHTVFYYHQWSNFLIWGILVDIGILSNRYGTYSKNRLLLHSIIMGLCVLPSVIAEVLMMTIWNPPQFHGNEKLAYLHAPIGFAFLGLMGLQSIGGLVLKLSIESQKQQSTMKYQSMFHIYLGYCMYIVGKIQCGLGFYEVYNPTKDEGKVNLLIFWIVYSVIFFWRVILEWFYLKGKLFKSQMKSQDLQCQPETLKDAMLIQLILQNDVENLQKDFSDQMWFIFNNQIVNLTGFVHPGGQYIWEKTKGRDISRFIYGIQGLEDGSCKAFRHSERAIILLKQHTIATLSQNNQIRQLSNLTDSSSNIWQVSSIKKLSSKVSYFGFKNSTIKIMNEMRSLNSFGHYFQITSTQNNKIPTRQYTQVLSMSPQNISYRKQLVSILSKTENFGEKIQLLNEKPRKLDELPLLIKKYSSQNGFSQHIHSETEKEFEILGPLGPSLPLTRQGNIVLICGGTGIFPFLDLLDFLLESIIYQVVYSKYGKEIASKFNPFDNDFDNNLKITLVFAVENKSELIGSDIYFPLVSIQKHLKEQRFNMVLRIKEADKGQVSNNERFSKNFFNKHIGNVLDYDQFLICGPGSMLKTIPSILFEMGVQQNQVHYV